MVFYINKQIDDPYFFSLEINVNVRNEKETIGLNENVAL